MSEVYQGNAGDKKAKTSLITLSQLADGSRIASCLDTVEKMLTSSSGLDPSIYRLKNVKINSSDLDDDLLALVRKDYDDSNIKAKIGKLEGLLEDKADKCDLGIYRKTTELISRFDLDDDLIKMIKSGDYDYIYDDTEIRSYIKNLQTTKSDNIETGFIKNLDNDFKNVLKESYNGENQVTMINALNFLFKFIQYMKSYDMGGLEPLQTGDVILDCGSVAQQFDPTDESPIIDYGRLYSNNYLKV